MSKLKPQQLTLEERAVIHNVSDFPLFNIIKGMSLEELRSFDAFKPVDLKHYVECQKPWLNEEKYLIGRRLGHNRKVGEDELLKDFEHYHNGERFRVWYVLKHPGKVELE